jgi:hypothetical protein
MKDRTRLSQFELFDRSEDIAWLLAQAIASDDYSRAAEALQKHIDLQVNIREELEYVWKKYTDLLAEKATSHKPDKDKLDTLIVSHDRNSGEMDVGIDNVPEDAEDLGEYLADVAREIARTYAGTYDENGDPEHAFDLICNGFNRSDSFFKAAKDPAEAPV